MILIFQQKCLGTEENRGCEKQYFRKPHESGTDQEFCLQLTSSALAQAGTSKRRQKYIAPLPQSFPLLSLENCSRRKAANNLFSDKC